MKRLLPWLILAAFVAWYVGFLAHLCGVVPGPWWAWWSPILAVVALVAWFRVELWLDRRREQRAIRRAFNAGLLGLTNLAQRGESTRDGVRLPRPPQPNRRYD